MPLGTRVVNSRFRPSGGSLLRRSIGGRRCIGGLLSESQVLLSTTLDHTMPPVWALQERCFDAILVHTAGAVREIVLLPAVDADLGVETVAALSTKRIRAPQSVGSQP